MSRRLWIPILVLALVMLSTAPPGVAAQEVVLSEGDEWYYTVSFTNKTSGEQYDYLAYVYAEPMGSGLYRIVYQYYAPGDRSPVMIVEYQVTKGLRVVNATYIEPAYGYTVSYIFDDPPPLVYYPSRAGDVYTHESTITVYYDGQPYYTMTYQAVYKAVEEASIVFNETPVSVYRVEASITYIDPDVGPVMQATEVYYVNESFKLPLIYTYDDDYTSITHRLDGYTLTPDPLEQAAQASEYRLRIEYTLTGNYTASPPNATVTVIGAEGPVAQATLDKLPLELALPGGDYVIEVYPSAGSTADGRGMYNLDKITIGGEPYTGEIAVFTLTGDTVITLEFTVYTVTTGQEDNTGNDTMIQDQPTDDTSNTSQAGTQQEQDAGTGQEAGSQDIGQEPVVQEPGTTPWEPGTAPSEATSQQSTRPMQEYATPSDGGGTSITVLAAAVLAAAAIGGGVGYLLLQRRRLEGARQAPQGILVPAQPGPVPVGRGEGLRCPSCGYVNRPQARFCRRCGARLQ